MSRVLIGEPEGRISLGRCKCICEDTYKMDFYTNMLKKYIYVSMNRDQKCISVKAVFNPRDT
jgi:hypothetical protein